MKVELIFDPGCPNVGEARAQLSQALRQLGLRERWKEWSLVDPEVPARLRGFGSPTILVDGRDVVDQEPAATGASCRVYREGSKTFGAPPASAIAAALSKARRSRE
jgi:hypothetical protein